MVYARLAAYLERTVASDDMPQPRDEFKKPAKGVLSLVICGSFRHTHLLLSILDCV